jgi:hypothetical protein
MLTAKDLKPNQYYFTRVDNGNWILVYAQDASSRPDDWFEEGYPKVEVMWMGWDVGDVSSGLKEYEFLLASFKQGEVPSIVVDNA